MNYSSLKYQSNSYPPSPEMCTVSSFDPADTQLSSTGILPDLTNPKYLKVGFTVSISCKSTDFDQPLGALDTHTCEEGHADKEIVIENCFSKFLRTLKNCNIEFGLILYNKARFLCLIFPSDCVAISKDTT